MSKPKKGQREAARPENKVSLDDVVALIKERKKYADWIAALEAKRDQTPANVYSKVHLDYETRLQAVVDKLSVHRGALSQEQESLKKKLEEVEQEIEERQEERSETELRAQIGELTAAALTEALMVADTELERLEAKQSTLEGELGRIEEFFAAVDGTGTGRISSPAVARPKSGGFDELSFLNSVVGEKKAAAVEEKPAAPPPSPPSPAPAPSPAPPPPPAPKVEPPAPPSEAPPLKPVEVPPASAPTPTPTPAPQADGGVEKATELEKNPEPKPIPRQSIAMQMASLTIEPGAGAKAQSDLGIIKTGDELPPSILEDLSPKTGPAKPLAANVASNDPFTLKASSAGNTKNLKCKECGTFNFSTEWYCEKCGAELSVL